MALTPVTKVTIASTIFVTVYVYLGLLSSHILTGTLLFALLTWILVNFVVNREGDIDTLASFVSNRRGFEVTVDSRIPPPFQNIALYVRKAPPLELIQDLWTHKLAKYDRLRRAVVPTESGRPVWCTKFFEPPIESMDKYIRQHSVENNDALYALMNEIGNADIPIDELQWSIHLIVNESAERDLDADEQFSVIFMRFSHGVADGLRLVPLATDLLTDMDGEPIEPPQIGKLQSKSSSKKSSVKIPTGFGLIKQVIKDIQAINDASNGVFDSISPFKPDKELFYSESQVIHRFPEGIPLDIVKFLKNKLNVSVNDVLTAAFAGAVNKYNEMIRGGKETGGEAGDVLTRSMIAYGFPSKRPFSRQTDWLYNDFSFVSWEIPCQMDSFRARANRAHANANEIRSSLVAWLTQFIANIVIRFGFLDWLLEKSISDAFRRHSCVFSNVPSFPEPVFLCGEEVTRIEASYFNLIPQVILLSYAGHIHATLVVDPERHPKADWILDFMAWEILSNYMQMSDGDDARAILIMDKLRKYPGH